MLVRCGAMRCDAVRCGCGAVRSGAVRCGAVRYDTMVVRLRGVAKLRAKAERGNIHARTHTYIYTHIICTGGGEKVPDPRKITIGMWECGRKC